MNQLYFGLRTSTLLLMSKPFFTSSEINDEYLIDHILDNIGISKICRLIIIPADSSPAREKVDDLKRFYSLPFNIQDF